jgi:DNA polymerase III delta prime subunit
MSERPKHKILLGLDRIRAQLGLFLNSQVGGRFLLIEGPQGTGRFDIAQELAQEWSGSLPLVQEPESKSGYSVEQIRKLCQEMQQTGLGSRKLVYILKHFEMMPPVSANAWLKSLEELPSHVWVIATALPDQVMPTLLSRALRLKTSLVSSNLLKQWLKEKGYSLTQEQWPLIDLYAAGSPARAMAYFDEHVQKRLALVLEFAAASSWTQAQSMAKKIEAFTEESEETKSEVWKEIIALLAGSWKIAQSDWQHYKKWLELLKESELALSRHFKFAHILERLWLEKDLWLNKAR